MPSISRVRVQVSLLFLGSLAEVGVEISLIATNSMVLVALFFKGY